MAIRVPFNVGVNVTAIVQPAPTARVYGQLLLSLKSGRSTPTIRMALIDSGTDAGFFSLTVIGGDVVPTTWFPKLTLAGDIAITLVFRRTETVLSPTGSTVVCIARCNGNCGRAIMNDLQAIPDARVWRGLANWIEIRLTCDEHDRNQAARSTTSVMSSCCGAPSANA